MLQQAINYQEECESLYQLLDPLAEIDWDAVTQFKLWTVNDIIGHLYLFDLAAGLTLRDEIATVQFFAEVLASMDQGMSLQDFGKSKLVGLTGRALLKEWRRCSEEVANRFGAEDPKRRVKWGGPDMSVRSCISARLMETWSHAQAIFDRFGVVRSDGDRIRDIAELGMNTFSWTFANRGLPVPDSKPYVRLTAPSGTLWEWGQPNELNVVEGSATEFCQVVAQTRNVADTGIRTSGETARQWMLMAQCFAGPPHDPPALGTRFRQAVTGKILRAHR
jgi:uncharacterized protein (TIGR03084 family)